jgi:hypothetical protein
VGDTVSPRWRQPSCARSQQRPRRTRHGTAARPCNRPARPRIPQAPTARCPSPGSCGRSPPRCPGPRSSRVAAATSRQGSTRDRSISGWPSLNRRPLSAPVSAQRSHGWRSTGHSPRRSRTPPPTGAPGTGATAPTPPSASARSGRSRRRRAGRSIRTSPRQTAPRAGCAGRRPDRNASSARTPRTAATTRHSPRRSRGAIRSPPRSRSGTSRTSSSTGARPTPPPTARWRGRRSPRCAARRPRCACSSARSRRRSTARAPRSASTSSPRRSRATERSP